MYHEWVFLFLFPAKWLISLYERHVVSVLYFKYFSLKYLKRRQEECARQKRRLTSPEYFPTQRDEGRQGGEERGERKEGTGLQQWQKSPLSLKRFGAQFCFYLHHLPHQGSVMDITGINVFHPNENKRTTRLSQGKRKANWLYCGGWHW